MKRTVLVMVCLVGAVAVVAGCSSDEPTGPAVEANAVGPDSPERATVVTEPGTVELAVGERATIRLESNVTTGYQWAPVSGPDQAVAGIVSANFRPGDSDRVGAAGTQDIVVEGKAAGTTELELGYSRPWELEEPPARTATFTIVVS